ncbi:hypothetical protein [Devosia salina]|uniref:XRE family transcriptional regulator n=1 Tax=Devosia salina TaxID=2860336 RepID=A0ABX8WE16_9HYPH|nr:hypothetical protein [Devosia salina]QYO75677.1 hypothetical protein K1X15_13670 [Devosia salina]
MKYDEEEQATRRQQLLEIMQLLYGENGRSELARDLRMSHSLISQMLRGEKPVSNKFLVRLMSEIDQILYAQAVELYHARELVLELGRSVVPSFDLPFIQSNETHDALLRQVERESAAFEADKPDQDDELLAEVERHQQRRSFKTR